MGVVGGDVPGLEVVGLLLVEHVDDFVGTDELLLEEGDDMCQLSVLFHLVSLIFKSIFE